MIKEIRKVYKNNKLDILEFFIKNENNEIIVYFGNHEFAKSKFVGENENEIIENAKKLL